MLERFQRIETDSEFMRRHARYAVVVDYLEKTGRTEQRDSLARLINQRAEVPNINPCAFDLPDDYLYCTFTNGSVFACGIAPDGSVSS